MKTECHVSISINLPDRAAACWGWGLSKCHALPAYGCNIRIEVTVFRDGDRNMGEISWYQINNAKFHLSKAAGILRGKILERESTSISCLSLEGLTLEWGHAILIALDSWSATCRQAKRLRNHVCTSHFQTPKRLSPFVPQNNLLVFLLFFQRTLIRPYHAYLTFSSLSGFQAIL